MLTHRTWNKILVVAALFAGLLHAGGTARAQMTSGTIFGTGLGSTPGGSGSSGRDTNWSVVAVPTGFTPPASQTTPYDAHVPFTAIPGFFVGGGSPQTGLEYLGDTNYWIAPQPTTASLVPETYNWIAQQQFNVPVTGFYRFDFPGAGDNEFEFYIGGAINTTDPLRPTITGGQQIGGRAGTFTEINTFTGGAQLTAGTHTAPMVLWDYGGETGALIGSSTFAPAVAYWAPGSGAGGTAGTVSVGENVNVNQIYFTTGGYLIEGGGGGLVYGNGGTITAQSGTGTINNAFGGTGTLNPGPCGTSSGILTATQLNPTDGLDLQRTSPRSNCCSTRPGPSRNSRAASSPTRRATSRRS
jgi:hypothetical protein